MSTIVSPSRPEAAGQSSFWSGRRTGLVRLGVVMAAGVLLAAAAPPTAPVPPPAKLPVFAEEVSVGWVLVPVVVRGRGGYVRDLEAGDFRLQVDGRPVKIRELERRSEAPWSIVVLQDVSGSMAEADKLEASRQALGLFLDRAIPGDELAVASFAGGATRVEVPFTEDLGAVREAMDAWEAYGTTALHDAIARLPEIASAARHPKRAALLITDGVDNASLLSATQAREVVRQAELPVYVLGLSTGDPFQLDPSGAKLFRYADALNLLASLTGGRYHAITGPDAMKEACAAIADDLRYQYVLSFPTAPSGKMVFHRLTVDVPGRKNLRVLTRAGYDGTSPTP
ncbi:MAG: VWA domain-containing protein [Holophagales bacterium]|nr:MAG: VWA domain-containing protein [Holophagales bacterium]